MKKADRRTVAELLDRANREYPTDPKGALDIAEEALPAARTLDQSDLLAALLAFAAKASVPIDPDRAERYAKEALPLAEELQAPRQHASLLNTLGAIATERRDYRGAATFYQKALEIGRNARDPVVVGYVASNLGQEHSYTGDFEEAVVLLKEALDVCRQHGMKEAEANALHNLALIYHKHGERDTAIKLEEQALEVFEAVGSVIGEITARGNICVSLVDVERAAEAKEQGLRAVELARKHGHTRNLAPALEAVGFAHQKLEEHDRARACFEEALALHVTNNSRAGEARVMSHLAGLRDTPPQEAGRLLDAALVITCEADMKPVEAEIRAALADWHERHGSALEALGHLRKAYELEKQMITDRSSRRMALLRVAHEVEQARKQTEIERLRNVELATALEQAEFQKERAEEQDRQKSQVLRIVAHDLRNLAGGVVGTGQQVREDLEEERPADELKVGVDLLMGAAEGLLAMLDQMMDASAIETGRISLRPQLMDVDDVITELTRDWERRAEEKGQTITTDSQPVQVMADRVRIREMVENLLSNAIKYSPRGSRIKIASKREGERIVISVTDQGPGIKQSDRDLMFRPFQRLSARPTNDEHSTGLGLFIVKQLADLHGGEVTVEQPEGGGSTFSLWLPVDGRDSTSKV